jgi:hypothetical protein
LQAEAKNKGQQAWNLQAEAKNKGQQAPLVSCLVVHLSYYLIINYFVKQLG